MSKATTSKVVPIGSDGASPSQAGASPSRGPGAVEVVGPITRVPSLEEIERLTEVPDRRVVYRGVDWSFYDRLVDSIPERSHIHVDYDGRDLEVRGKRRKHEIARKRLGQLVEAIAQELAIPYRSAGETTWKRPQFQRGLEADECYFFLPEKIAADAAACERGSDAIDDFLNPDLAIEVDLSPPQVHRAGIYAALRVAEVWRFDGRDVAIDRLMPNGTYTTIEASPFLPITAQEIRRWVVDEAGGDESAWAMRLRAEFRSRAATTDHGQGTTDN
jgi:Uma2 family endonuclease